MTALGRLLFGGEKKAAKPRAGGGSVDIRARYDSAETTDENRRHWAAADDKSANAANSAAVRRVLRKRARYECANNPNIGGLVRTIAYDTVGTGPRLQLSAGASPAQRDGARLVEKRFKAWARAASLADKLRVMAAQKTRDGEAFAVMTTNGAMRHPVQLDLRPVEPEQVTTPDLYAAEPGAVDGIVFDRWGNPSEYHTLRGHPGDGTAGFGPDSYDRVPAAKMVHWFRPDRSGQARGVPELAPMLALAAYQRRYLLATVAAAEFASSVAGVLESDFPPGSEDDSVEPLLRVEFERGALMTTPAGARLKQLEAEQPTGTFKEFNGELLCAMGRAVDAPFNVIAGNSSGYNYSSGRLDHLGYHRNIWVERDRLRDVCLDPLFREWLDEAALVPGVIPDGLPPAAEWEWDWHWDGFGAIDPEKDAAASAARKANGTSTLSEECAAEGKDWREVMAQQAAERAEALRLALPDPYAPAAPAAAPAPAEREEPADANA